MSSGGISISPFQGLANLRQLKNYLVEKGHALVLRYQTSRNISKYEYANHDQIRVERLTPELLASFDLVLMDSNVLNELSENEKNQLHQSVHAGLGMVILLNDLPGKGKNLNHFLPFGSQRTPHDTVHIRFSASKLYTLPALPVEIASDPSIQPITQQGRRTLSGYWYSGFGKIAFQMLQETYRIRLEGNDDDYATVWSTLIGQTARTKEHMFTIALDSPFPYYPNEPISIEVISSGDEPSVYSRNSLLPLSEDVMVDDLWRGKTWADQAGWHQFLVKEDSTTLNYLVSANGEWNTLRTTNQIKLNELAQKSTGSSPERAKHYESTEIPDLVFFLTFLISSAFLWLAPKI